jgi:adenosylhomocysteine nucleosidase
MPGSEMRNLIVIPTKLEMDLFIKKWSAAGLTHKVLSLGRHEALEFAQIGTAVALGGLGKVQFGIQTQYLIDKIEDPKAVLCIGASGAFAVDLSPGDVVVATETVEHDIRKFSRPLIPRFASDGLLLAQFKCLSEKQRSYNLHFGAIASGDEDIMSDNRKKELREKTGALAVAWEGAGGARACHFSDIPFIEVRGITDFASYGAEDDFFKNLEGVMGNLGELLIDWASDGEHGNNHHYPGANEY